MILGRNFASAALLALHGVEAWRGQTKASWDWYVNIQKKKKRRKKTLVAYERFVASSRH
jgi:hypothetical protein